MKKIKAFLKKKDVVFTLQRYGIDALGAMESMRWALWLKACSVHCW